MNFFRGVRHAKQLIAEGKIGKLLYCHSARNGWEEPQPSISWKKLRSKSGGHLYHHIHEVDCIQFLMGHATEVTMTGGNVAHQGERFGDEDDMLFLLMELDVYKRQGRQRPIRPVGGRSNHPHRPPGELLPY